MKEAGTEWDDLTFFQLIIAADFLVIPNLLDLCMQTLAYLIRKCTDEPNLCAAEKFRRTFKIKNDWTPEEEEKVSKEVECFEER